MGHSFAVQIVIIGSCGWWSLKAQDTLAVYFSARGFSFDSYYRTAILSTSEPQLSGKVAFLLHLADTLADRLHKERRIGLNLHRAPWFGSYLEGLEQLPTSWEGILWIQRMTLIAQPQKAVYARSNRLESERYYALSTEIEGTFLWREGKRTFLRRIELPADGWREALLQALLQEASR